MQPKQMENLEAAFGTKLHENVSMANYTTARVGGLVPALISIHTLDELSFTARTLWRPVCALHHFGQRIEHPGQRSRPGCGRRPQPGAQPEN
jgi:hypothetical protein